MLKSRLVQVGTLAVLAIALVAPRGALLAQGAQGVQGGQAAVQLAFGYECDDRFLVRNDGSQPVTVEYGVPGDAQRSSLDLKGNESVELASTSTEPLELWVGGKLVATERKGNRPCAANAQSAPNMQYAQGGGVVVVPLEPQEYLAAVEPAYYAAPALVYVHPAHGYGYGYRSGYGYRAPSVSVVAPFASRGGAYAGRAHVASAGEFRGGSFGGARPGGHRPAPGRPAHSVASARSAQVSGAARAGSHGGGSSHRANSGGSSRGAHAGGRAHH